MQETFANLNHLGNTWKCMDKFPNHEQLIHVRLDAQGWQEAKAPSAQKAEPCSPCAHQSLHQVLRGAALVTAFCRTAKGPKGCETCDCLPVQRLCM